MHRNRHAFHITSPTNIVAAIISLVLLCTIATAQLVGVNVGRSDSAGGGVSCARHDSLMVRARIPYPPQAPARPPADVSSIDRQSVAISQPPRTLVPTSTRLIHAPSEFGASEPPQCDDDGNIYFHSGIQGSYRDSPILRLSTSNNFQLYRVPPDYTNLAQHGQMSIAPDGTFWLALSGLDTAILLRFNSDGVVTSDVRLDRFANFVLEKFVAFNNDVFFIGGFPRPTAAEATITRHGVMLNASGQELSTPRLDLPSFDLRSKGPADGAASAGKDGNLYVLSSQEVVVVSQSGEILRHLPFEKPNSDYSASRVSVSGGLVSIWFAKPGEDHRISFELLVLDAVSGEEFGRYSVGKELGHAMPVCFSRQDGFTFLGGITEGKVKLITAALP